MNKLLIIILLILNILLSQDADVGLTDMGSTGSKSVTGLSYQPAGMLGILDIGGTTGKCSWMVSLSDMTNDSGSVAFTGQYVDGTTPLYANDSYSWAYKDYVWAHSVKGNVDGDATWTSVESDGFTFNVTDADAHDYAHLTWGGGQAVTKVSQFHPSGTTGNQSITGVGFQPNAVIMVLTGRGSGFGGQTQHAELNFGFMADNGGQYVQGFHSHAGNGYHYSWGLTNACIIAIDATITGQASYVSMDSDGFTINWSNASSSSEYISYLAIGGVEAHVGTSTFQGSTGTWAVSGFGFEPDAVIGAFEGDHSAGIGFATSTGSTDHAYMTYSHWHGQDPSVSDQFSDDTWFLVETRYDGTLMGFMDISSFDSDGLTFDQADVGNTGAFGYLAFKVLEAIPAWQINIGDVWKPAVGVQINIGDAWKEVPATQINIGDAWKEN